MFAAKHDGIAMLALILSLFAIGTSARDDQEAKPGFNVKGEVALASLMALSDGHLQKMADSLHLVAASAAGRSGEWEKIRGPLAEAAERNVAALNWFALPDGSYWSLQNGKEGGNLARRAYFPRVLAGETIIGDLVVSTATRRPVAIVAVPIARANGSIVGVLGASVYLDRLGERLQREMALNKTAIFYSFDRSALVALDWDPHLIFIEPLKTDEPDLIRAFREMLSREQGIVRYVFRGKERTVLFRKSSLTDWWYAFGVIPEGREAREPLPSR